MKNWRKKLRITGRVDGGGINFCQVCKYTKKQYGETQIACMVGGAGGHEPKTAMT